MTQSMPGTLSSLHYNQQFSHRAVMLLGSSAKGKPIISDKKSLSSFLYIHTHTSVRAHTYRDKILFPEKNQNSISDNIVSNTYNYNFYYLK